MLDKKILNKLIIAASVLLLIYSSYEFKKKNDGELKVKVGDIGEVFKKDNQLRRKTAGSLSWVDIDHSSKLYPGDRVFTGDQAIAQLNLLHLAEIGMGSTTLIKIDESMGTKDGELKIEAGTGFFSTKLSDKIKKSTVKLRDASVTLEGQGSEVHVNSSEGKTMVTAVAGKINFEAVDASGKMVMKALAPNQILGLSQAGTVSVVSMPVKLLEPLQSSRVIQQSSSPVVFKWQNLKKGSTISLEASKFQNFDPVFFKKDVSNLSKTSVVFEEKMQGPVYWRIVESGDVSFFHSQLFDLQFLDPPVIVNPGKDQSLTSPLPKEYEFSWEKKSDFQFDFELEQIGGGASGALKKRTSFASFRPENITPGKYRLRVRSVKLVDNKDAMVSPWSEWRAFAVEVPKLAKVDLLKPDPDSEPTLLEPSNEVRFEWNGNSPQYSLLVSTEQEFKKPILNQQTNRAFFQWRPLAPGIYYWTVKNDANEKITEFRKFKITEVPLALVEPENKIEKFFESGSKRKVHFAWTGKSLNGFYVFEYAEDPGFNKGLVSKQLKDTSIDVVFDNTDRQLYWRVRTDFAESAKGETGANLYWAIGGAKPDFQTSETRKIELLAKPQLIQVVLEPLTVRIQEDKTVFGGVNDNLPTNYGSGFVELTLPPVETAASYKVEIYRDKSAKELLLSKTIKAPIYRWNSPKPGQYFWKVSYTSIDGSKSPASEIGQIKVEPSDKSSDSTSSGKITY